MQRKEVKEKTSEIKNVVESIDLIVYFIKET